MIPNKGGLKFFRYRLAARLVDTKDYVVNYYEKR